MTFTDRLRGFFKGFLDRVGSSLYQLGIGANFITIMGIVGNIVAAWMISRGILLWGGVVALLIGPLDAIDGAVARAGKGVTSFGAFLDSVTDRYSELALFFGLYLHFMHQMDENGIVLTFIAAAGSVLVSYTRARAESLGYSIKAGLMTRVERYLVLVPGIILGIPKISLWILAIFANFTAFQRIWLVWKQSKNEKKE